MDNMQRQRHFGVVSPKWDVNIIHFPSRLKDLCGRGVKNVTSQRRWVTSRITVCCRHSRTKALIYL